MALNSFQAPQKKSALPNIILVVVIFAVLAGGGYWYFQVRENPIPSDQAPGDSSANGSASPANVISSEDQAKVDAITQAVATLRSLNLDIKFFEDPRFTSLEETEIEIPDISPDPDRKHPFEFIGSVPPAPVPETATTGKKK